MEVDKEGRRYGAKFAKSVICSKARMTYNKVNKILAGDKGLREEYAFLVETAEKMNDLAHALYKRRIERGALELDIPEAEIRVDENGMAHGPGVLDMKAGLVMALRRERQAGRNLLP